MRGMMQVEPLYHQTVAGRKTQTRRTGGLDEVNEDPEAWKIGRMCVDEKTNNGSYQQFFLSTLLEPLVCKPHYRVGEVLYMKEPTAIKTTFPPGWADGEPNTHEIEYRYDHRYDDDRIKWKNKMFMPASAARVFLQITGIRCERLLDISDEDCIAEGIETVTANDNAYKIYTAKPKDGLLHQFSISPKESYLSLFRFANKISPKAPIVNVWCWVYEYKLIDKP